MKSKSHSVNYPPRPKNDDDLLALFITCPKGIEGLLQEELDQIGATTTKQTVGAVQCKATLKIAYQICLWSRLANRVFMLLAEGSVSSSQACYQLATQYPWSQLFKADTTLSVSFTGRSDFMRNTVYGAQIIKDGIVDNLRKTLKKRPDIDTQNPDCRISARLHHGKLSLFYDLSGHSLHQRGYRLQAGTAPIKENLATALLIRAGWPKIQSALIDPFCGSGTFLIEAAMMATEKAPGLDRFDYGFLHWQGHQPALWQQLQKDALEKHEEALEKNHPIFIGFDKDPEVVQFAKKNIKAAGFSDLIQIEQRSIKDFSLPENCMDKNGLIIANPPYGERQEDSAELMPLYQEIGTVLNQHAQNWSAAIFTSDPTLAKAIGLRSHKQYPLLNGTIPCQLYLFNLNEQNRLRL